MQRIKRPAVLVAALLAVPGAAVSLPASATEPAAPLAVEAFGYPDAAKILAEQNLTLKAGDGNIRLADCASESGLVRVVRQVAAPYEVCFKITGPSGYLALETPNVINIKGDSHAIKATLSTEGATSNVDITKNDWTPVGQADNSTGNKPAVLLELVATDGTAAATPAPEFPAVGSIAVGAPGRAGSRGCTGTLVDPLWVLTSAGCFTDNPAQLAAGAPGVKSSFTAGGHSSRHRRTRPPRRPRHRSCPPGHPDQRHRPAQGCHRGDDERVRREGRRLRPHRHELGHRQRSAHHQPDHRHHQRHRRRPLPRHRRRPRVRRRHRRPGRQHHRRHHRRRLPRLASRLPRHPGERDPHRRTGHPRRRPRHLGAAGGGRAPGQRAVRDRR